jgi:hypothetical protein
VSSLIPVPEPTAYRTPAIAALDEDAPRLEELFRFMVDAELRVSSLRMRVVERTITALGEETVTSELALRHPGGARIVRRHSEEPLSREYEVWASDGELVTTYDATNERASVRPLLPRPVGATSPELPAFARVRPPRTALPPEDIMDTFLHPNGLIRNVLLTGPVALVGTALLVSDREAFILRCDHPRLNTVLTDRPDHWYEVGVDRQIGMILLLVEHVGDQVTRHAEVTSVEVDPVIHDEALRANLPPDVRMLY